MKYILILTLLILCSSTNQTNDLKQKSQFRQFIKRQKIIKLPTRIVLYENYEGLIKPSDSDTAILHESTRMEYLGLLDDTSKYYYVIPMFPGDDLCPLLYVFSKSGNLIDKSRLLIGRYGSNCGAYVYGFTIINKDLSITTQDSLVLYNCDSNGNENRDSVTIYLNTQKMKILNTGKVQQEKEIEKILKN